MRTSKWTLETLTLEAQKYETKKDFKAGSRGAYSTMIDKYSSNKKEICSHMTRPKSNKWDLKSIRSEALKYENRRDFKKYASGAYQILFLNFKEEQQSVMAHMKFLKKGSFWTLEKITNEAKKYNRISDFVAGSLGAYSAMMKRFNDKKNIICSHMETGTQGFRKEKSAILYYLRVEQDGVIAYKIGITNKTVDERYLARDLDKITVLFTLHYQNGAEAHKREQEIMREFADDKYTGEPLLRDGNTELFNRDILNKDTQGQLNFML